MTLYKARVQPDREERRNSLISNRLRRAAFLSAARFSLACYQSVGISPVLLDRRKSSSRAFFGGCSCDAPDAPTPL